MQVNMFTLSRDDMEIVKGYAKKINVSIAELFRLAVIDYMENADNDYPHASLKERRAKERAKDAEFNHIETGIVIPADRPVVFGKERTLVIK